MISKLEISSMPFAGEFEEVVYDIANSWNSQCFTWVRFEDEFFNVWYGSFRGKSVGTGISVKNGIAIVLTTDYFYELDVINGKLISHMKNDIYRDLIATPKGDFLISDDYHIEKLESITKETTFINVPLDIDNIKFLKWDDGLLYIEYTDFYNYENCGTIVYSEQDNDITIKNFT